MNDKDHDQTKKKHQQHKKSISNDPLNNFWPIYGRETKLDKHGSFWQKDKQIFLD